jgi:hypothetical protein
MRQGARVIRLLKGYKGTMLRTSGAGDLDISHRVISTAVVGNAPGAQIKEEGKGGGNSRS